MTKTVEEVRRAAFELHMNVNHPSISLRCYGEAQGCTGCNDYEDDMASAMYAAFNAALDAVEIQLPTDASIHPVESPHAVLHDCRAAIEQTGLGLRVK